MLLYNRAVQISAGPPGGPAGSAVTELRCSFSVEKTVNSKENRIRASIYNLGPNSRSEFEKVGNRIFINAGYLLTGSQTLAIGDISFARTDYTGPDIVTEIEAADAGAALRGKRASVSYKSGTPAKRMVEDLVGLLDVDLPDFDLDLSDSFKTGWSYVGRARDALDQLASRFGFDWSIQNNALQITKTREPSKRQAVLLSPDSGLIGTPEVLDANRDRTEKSKKKELPGLRARSLLNPALIPGDPVIIRSNYLGEGTYRILSVYHQGDTHGTEWYSEVECVETKK